MSLTEHRKSVLAALHEATLPDVLNLMTKRAIKWLADEGYLKLGQKLTTKGYDALGLPQPQRSDKGAKRLSNEVRATDASSLLPRGAQLVLASTGQQLGYFIPEPDEHMGIVYNKWVYGPDKKPIPTGFATALERATGTILTHYNKINGTKLIRSSDDLYKGSSNLADAQIRQKLSGNEGSSPSH